MIRTTFRVARYIPGPIGPLRLIVNGITCTLSFGHDPPRSPVPPGGAEGNGAIVTVEHQASAGLADAELVAEAFELALKSTNRALHALAFAGGKQRPVPLLSGEDLEGTSCVDDPGGAARALPTSGLFPRRPVRINLDATDRTAAVQALLDPPPAEFTSSHTLWSEALEAFYAGRNREAVVLARAALEVGWETAARAAARDLAAHAQPPIQAGIFAAYVKEALASRALADRFNQYSKALLGFSFSTDWDTAKWGRLITFFELRNDVAHEGFQPLDEDALGAITLAREVLDRLAALRQAQSGSRVKSST